jgi:hypothetical protein
LKERDTVNDAYVCRRCNYNQFIGGPCYSCGSFDVMQSSLSSREMLGAIDELFRRLEIAPVVEEPDLREVEPAAK